MSIKVVLSASLLGVALQAGANESSNLQVAMVDTALHGYEETVVTVGAQDYSGSVESTLAVLEQQIRAELNAEIAVKQFNLLATNQPN